MKQLNLSAKFFQTLFVYPLFLQTKLYEGASTNEDLFDISCVEFYIPENGDEKQVMFDYIDEVRKSFLN